MKALGKIKQDDIADGDQREVKRESDHHDSLVYVLLILIPAYSACVYTASTSAANHSPCLEHLIKLVRQSSCILQHYLTLPAENSGFCVSATKFLMYYVQC